MKLQLLFLLLLLIPIATLSAQTKINGTVTDRKGEPLQGASISIIGSYDGATTDSLGRFSFKTRKKDSVTLAASYLGYEPERRSVLLSASEMRFDFRLKEEFNELNAVVITAGTFEASDNKRMVMLKPLDIVTTAGGGADITAVMQLLPGANRVGEQEGLFVRGGSANETKTIIDGMIVQNPFFSSTPDVPQRGRFSPFQFKGTAFSTGGYSAQYGQALSSVLLLDTQDKVTDQSSINVTAHLAGVGVGYTHKGAVGVQLFYSNLAPFLALVNTNIDFKSPPETIGGSLSWYKNTGKKGVLKMYATYTDNNATLGLPDYAEANATYEFALRNRNFFTNNTHRFTFGANDSWSWTNGFSWSYNTDQLRIQGFESDRSDMRVQGRSVLKHFFGKNQQHAFTTGVEVHRIEADNNFDVFRIALNDNYSAAFAETDYYISPKLALRAGVRAEYSSSIEAANAAPRLSLAYKTGSYSQVSMAAGRFWQTPEINYLFLNRQLKYERADHLILNYQIIKNDRTFRMEVFHKDYGNLVREQQPGFDPNPFRFPTGPTDNSGEGYARGFDVFVRDKKTLKSGDLWLTYSFLDTRRLFLNYPVAAMPTFASKHNFSAVYKQFFSKIMCNAGLTYTYSSGRPYFDFNQSEFLSDRTKPFHNLSLAVSHIRIIRGNFLVIFASIDNITARKNEFGFRYSPDGQVRTPVRPVAYRTAFFGATMSIGRSKKAPKEADLDF
jgi:CarboxypepD_reg-like domain/TonB dependent receptor/TonB-dependent Receptor Plug Domain